MPKRATIEDIARLAGVSRGTVSRVLNRRPDVDRETRARVLRVIEEQGYVPSLTAAGLAGGRNRLIGMVVPVFTWVILGELVRGITEILKRTAYELVLYTFNDEDLNRDRRDIINRLLATQLTAGLLAVYPGGLSEQLTELYFQGVPVVVIDDQREQVVPWVRADDVTGAYQAVDHLIQLGHRRIAHIQGPREYLVSHDRHQGYLRALENAGIAPDAELIVEGDFLPQSGYAGAQRLFDLPPDKRPTAIFAAADQMAYGVLRAAEERALSIPGDIALVGFDDDAPSAHVLPPLTTVRQPSFEMGQEGVKLLLALLAEQEAGDLDAASPAERATPASSRRIVLPATLIVRASSGAKESSSLLTR
ncbi:MAG TPA: LacI family DNA-binding transcriptional regulator [Ktedonobacterales bacterium]|nr:LacI family DNA-binding transcriptional regulator [Ktedonobacterales bacterium]